MGGGLPLPIKHWPESPPLNKQVTNLYSITSLPRDGYFSVVKPCSPVDDKAVLCRLIS